MNSSMNLHGITSIKAEMVNADGYKWTELTFADKNGNRFSLSVHSNDWLPIEGADLINQITQAVRVDS